MPLLLLLPVLLVLLVIVLTPLAIVQRYRSGTRRQRARGWLVAINLAGLALSTVLFLAAATVTSIWVPDARIYTAAGLAAGVVAGLLGLLLTRWEPALDALYYTPNRPLVLTLTIVITARVLYGFWRAWESWRAGLSGGSWFVEAGVAGAMAAGAVVLGYYLTYWIGVRRQLRRHAHRRLRRV